MNGLVLKRFDDGGIPARERAAKRAALDIAARNALADCTPKVPINMGRLGSGEVRGDLRRSGRAELRGDEAYVEWGGTSGTATYARPQYENSYHHTAPGVTDHWFEKVKQSRGEAWREMYARTLRQRMGVQDG